MKRILMLAAVAVVAVLVAGTGTASGQEGSVVREPAKLEVARNVIDRGERRLDVLAPITKRASGQVQVELHAAGKRYRFGADVNSAQGYVRFRKQIPRAQARLGTGIVTINYAGNERTRGQEVRLRAASGRAQLDAQRPELAFSDGQLRLHSKGKLSQRARGVVRVQLDWVDASGKNRSYETKAKIDDGAWRLSEALPDEVRTSIEGRRSTVHSYTLFTGYAPARMRGEMQAYEVLPAPAPAPAPAVAPNAAPPAGPAPAPPPPPPQPDDGGVSFPQRPDPLAVTHTLESDRAVTRTMQSSGGTVSATAENGTKYTLSLPSGALVSAQDVTLTPVAAVNGSPLSGDLLGAVEILPHGLELLKPATLTIEPAGSAGALEGQTGFLSHEAGEDFHLYPLAMGEGLKLDLTHFSTPGVAQATDADRQMVLSHPPERQRAQYEQMTAEVLREARIAQIADANAPLPADALADILLAYYDDVVFPLVQQAYTDDTVATRAISELLSWARQVQLLGLQEHPKLKARHDAVIDNLVAIMENAINKGFARCVDDHDLDYIVRLVSLARMGQLLGATFGADAWDKAQRCASFEIDFDSKITQSHDGPGGDGWGTSQIDGTWHVQGLDIPVGITGFGNGSLTWAEFSFLWVRTYPCSDGGTLRYEERGTATRPDEEFGVLLGMDLNLREPGTPPPSDRDISLRLFAYDDIGETYQETATSWCGDPPPPTPPFDEERWRGHYDWLHVDEYLTGIRDWDLGTGDLVASKSYSRSAGSLSELTRVEVWHTPLK